MGITCSSGRSMARRRCCRRCLRLSPSLLPPLSTFHLFPFHPFPPFLSLSLLDFLVPIVFLLVVLVLLLCRRCRRRRCLRSTRPFDRSRCIPHDIATVLLRLVSPYLLPRDHEREPDKRIDGQNGQRRMAHGPRDIWHVRIQIRLGRLRSLTHDTTEKGKRMLPRAKPGDVD